MAHPSDPVETPPPRRVDPLAQSVEELVVHECLHPELIDDVRQQRKDRPARTARLWTLGIAALTLVVGSIGGLATCVYTQGQAAGAAAVRVEAVEARAREDREATDVLRQRQREDATAAVQRHEELLEELHRIDSRLGRLEERLPARR